MIISSSHLVSDLVAVLRVRLFTSRGAHSGHQRQNQHGQQAGLHLHRPLRPLVGVGRLVVIRGRLTVTGGRLLGTYTAGGRRWWQQRLTALWPLGQPAAPVPPLGSGSGTPPTADTLPRPPPLYAPAVIEPPSPCSSQPPPHSSARLTALRPRCKSELNREVIQNRILFDGAVLFDGTVELNEFFPIFFLVAISIVFKNC